MSHATRRTVRLGDGVLVQLLALTAVPFVGQPACAAPSELVF